MTDVPATSTTCTQCHGTGFAVRGAADGVDRAVRCSCRDERREAQLLAAAAIPRRYEHCTLDGFENHHPSHPQALQIARRFVKEYPLGDAGLLLTGPCGSGKTHLVVGILRALIIERGARCLFYDFQDLLKEIQSSYSPVSQASETEILRPVFDADVLVLDDLGAQKPTAWVRDTVAHIINNRYNDRRTTLFTTNRLEASDPRTRGRLETAEATLRDQIGERINSRLYEMCVVVPLDGDDYRRTTKHPGVRSQMEGPQARRRPA
jgi:DNA replication protein DnaC